MRRDLTLFVTWLKAQGANVIAVVYIAQLETIIEESKCVTRNPVKFCTCKCVFITFLVTNHHRLPER